MYVCMYVCKNYNKMYVDYLQVLSSPHTAG